MVQFSNIVEDFFKDYGNLARDGSTLVIAGVIGVEADMHMNGPGASHLPSPSNIAFTVAIAVICSDAASIIAGAIANDTSPIPFTDYGFSHSHSE